MPVRVPEVASVLALLLILLIAKQIPVFDGLPIKNIMKVVLFAAGLGTRIREYSTEIPKPMIPVGGQPIISHLMEYYSDYGHQDEFVGVCKAVMPKALQDLARREHLAEVVLLSTCNRTEIYSHATLFHPAMQDVRDFLSDVSGVDPDEFSDLLYAYHDDAAVAHLFGVAAAYKNLARYDPQMKFALTLFPEAQQLLNMSRQSNNGRRAAR